MTVSPGRARSSAAFDWLMASLSVLLMGGVLLDGWAHSHGEVDQSFLTPWHALLYGSMGLNGIALAAAGMRNLLRSGRWTSVAGWHDALPTGYWGSAFGVVLFIFGGAFDGLWHTFFGIETGISLLISPSHLLLAFALALIASGPLRSVAVQYDRRAGGWRRIGPAVLATWTLLSLVSFFLAYAQPIEDGFTALTIQPAAHAVVYPAAYAIDPSGTATRIPLAAHTLLAAVTVAPDGKRFAYRVNRFASDSSQPPSDLYVAATSGAHPVRITHSSRHDTLPQWSPDGRNIAYISMPAGTSGNFSIHVVHPDGSGDRALVDGATTIDSLAWSPDSQRIAYASRNGTVAMIAVVDLTGARSVWLPFTAGASSPAWHAARLAYVNASGALRESSMDGSRTRTLVTSGADLPAWSRDGRRLAYIANDGADSQAFVAGGDGSHPNDRSLLSGLNVTSLAWSADGRLFLTAVGRRDPTHTELGFSLAQTALLLQAVVVAAALLLLLRRWPPPAGTCTVMLTAFALAMALQSDYYYTAIPAFVTGLAADIAMRFWGDRLRGGSGFYAFGFLLPAAFNGSYLLATVLAGGGHSGWPWNLLLGAPLLAGAAGMLLAFCFDSPLEAAGGAKSSPTIS